MNNGRVLVPRAVMDGILAIRLSGKTNMFDFPEVVRLAVEMGFTDAAIWIENNTSLYNRGILCGFRVMEGGERPCADKQG